MQTHIDLLDSLDKTIEENKEFMNSKENPKKTELVRDIKIIEMFITNTKNKAKIIKLTKKRAKMVEGYNLLNSEGKWEDWVIVSKNIWKMEFWPWMM